MSLSRIYAGFLVWLAIAVTAEVVWARTPREAFREAQRAFDATNYTDAATAFLEAADAVATAQDEDATLDPAIPTYNAGLAALAAGDLTTATNLLATPAPSGSAEDLKSQAQVAYNQGILLYQQAQEAMQGMTSSPMALSPAGGVSTSQTSPDASVPQTPAPVETADAAVEAFRRAVLLDADNLPAKQNYELALALQQQALQQQQQQQQQQDQQSQDSQEQEQQQEQGQQDEQSQQEQQQTQDQQDEQQQQPTQSSQDEQDQQQETASDEAQDGEEMTPEEAQMLLDSMADQEQSQRDRLRLNLGRPIPVEKDW